jgi:hypothetical protein
MLFARSIAHRIGPRSTCHIRMAVALCLLAPGAVYAMPDYLSGNASTVQTAAKVGTASCRGPLSAYAALKTAATDEELRSYYLKVRMSQGVSISKLNAGREHVRAVVVQTGSGVAINRVFIYLVRADKRILCWEGRIPMDWYPWEVRASSSVVQIRPKGPRHSKRSGTPTAYSLRMDDLRRAASRQQKDGR